MWQNDRSTHVYAQRLRILQCLITFVAVLTCAALGMALTPAAQRDVRSRLVRHAVFSVS